MRRFEYVQPQTVDEAVSFLASNADDSLLMSGGTAAVVLLEMGVARPRYVVDLGRIADLAAPPSEEDDGLRMGALTTMRTLERDPVITGKWAPLAEAASQVANVRVRNVATVGGSIGYGEPQTDAPPMLIALGAAVTLAGPGGERTVPLDGFFWSPYETALGPGEIVTGVSVPPLGERAGGCHLKFTIGSPENKPVANVSALLRLDADRRCEDARIVMGAAGPVPLVAAAAERLRGEMPSDGLIAEVARLASLEAEPIEDVRGPVWYKRRIIRVLVERALKCALQRAEANLPRA
jgi:carbon-monoxide dehydrogenase medium subunit